MVAPAPRDARDIQALLAEGQPVEVLGSGSKRAIGGRTPARRQLACTGLEGIRFFEPAELALGVRAGTRLSAIEAALASANHRLAFEPPILTAADEPLADPTIGGLVASNASGSARLTRGALRDHLLGFEGVNGLGQVIKSGGRVMKNVTGLDLCKLVSGSWGTLVVLTDVVLKTLPRAELDRTLLLPCADAATATGLMTQALGSPFDVTAAAFDPQRQRVLLRLEGIEQSVNYRSRELTDLLRLAGEQLDNAESIALWRAMGNGAPLRDSAGAGQELWRLSVAPQAGAAVLDRAQRQFAARGLLDWGGGLVWLSLPAGEMPWTVDRLLGGQAGQGIGLVTGERAFGSSHPGLGAQARAALAQRVKTAFDPQGLLNPQRLYAQF